MTWGEDKAAKMSGRTATAAFVPCLAMEEPATPPCQIIDLAELKTILGVTDPAYDAELTRLINVYSAAIETYTARKLCSAAREAVYIPRRHCFVPKFVLPQYPVTAVAKVEIDGNDIDQTDWLVDGNEGTLYPLSGTGWSVHNAALVQSTAGYSPIPADVQDAAVQLISSAFGAGPGAQPTGPVKMARVEGAVAESYFDHQGESGALSIAHFAHVLDRYRSERAFI